MNSIDQISKHNPSLTYQSTIFFFAPLFTLPYAIYSLVSGLFIPMFFSLVIMLFFSISLFLSIRQLSQAAIVLGLVTLSIDIVGLVSFFGISLGFQHYLIAVNVLISVSARLKRSWTLAIIFSMLSIYIFIISFFGYKGAIYEIPAIHKVIFNEVNMLLAFTILAISFYRYHLVLNAVESELKRYHGQAVHLAKTDALTDLPNRRNIEDELEILMYCAENEDTNYGVSVALGDIDDFKNINDTYGHQFGDAVLKELAGRFKNLTRTNDFVGRWGGEEFIFILNDTTPGQAFKTMERLRIESTRAPIESNGESVQVTISFGVSCCRKSDTKKMLFKRVDELLYKAKQAGKDMVLSDS